MEGSKPTSKPPKKRTLSRTRTKAVWLFRANREVFDAIEAEAERRSVTPNAMLIRIIKDWFAGEIPTAKEAKKIRKRRKEEDELPWYLKKKKGGE